MNVLMDCSYNFCLVSNTQPSEMSHMTGVLTCLVLCVCMCVKLVCHNTKVSGCNTELYAAPLKYHVQKTRPNNSLSNIFLKPGPPVVNLSAKQGVLLLLMTSISGLGIKSFAPIKIHQWFPSVTEHPATF